MSKLTGRVLTPGGWVEGSLHIEADKVVSLEPARAAERYVLPGFIDLHVHGGAGGDCMAGEEAARTAARFHASHGTTRMLLTTLTTAPMEGSMAVTRASLRP